MGRSLSLPLRVREGVFETTDSEESLLAFAESFFHEWRGSVPDDPDFGAAGTAWGGRQAPLAPLEPILNEFRRRYGTRLEARASVEKVGRQGGGEIMARFVTVRLRSNPDRRVVIRI